FAGVRPLVISLRDKQLGDARPALLLLWAAVGVVLLVACANVLNLLLSRNLARAREFSIRQALGASQGRLIQQGLIESALLAVCGIVAGVLVADFAAALLARVDPATVPRLHELSL